ncbi:MAG: TetR/AcrR family transcriptional regulator, partial [Rhodocyclaceae bacterium]|nr:TetR/AcrR family transcriptional regulator [Rhodocyclaceae bacterium]
EIVAAVIALTAERGPDGVTTQAVADRVGITQAAIFRHFPDKAALWMAVFDWAEQALGEALAPAFGSPDGPVATVEAVFLAHVDFVVRNPAVPRVLFHELQHAAETPFRARARILVDRYRGRIEALLKRGKESGELPPGLDEQAAAMLFVGTVQGLFMQTALLRGERSMGAAARRLWPLLQAAIGAARP